MDCHAWALCSFIRIGNALFCQCINFGNQDIKIGIVKKVGFFPSIYADNQRSTFFYNHTFDCPRMLHNRNSNILFFSNRLYTAIFMGKCFFSPQPPQVKEKLVDYALYWTHRAFISVFCSERRNSQYRPKYNAYKACFVATKTTQLRIVCCY